VLCVAGAAKSRRSRSEVAVRWRWGSGGGAARLKRCGVRGVVVGTERWTRNLEFGESGGISG